MFYCLLLLLVCTHIERVFTPYSSPLNRIESLIDNLIEKDNDAMPLYRLQTIFLVMPVVKRGQSIRLNRRFNVHSSINNTSQVKHSTLLNKRSSIISPHRNHDDLLFSSCFLFCPRYIFPSVFQITDRLCCGHLIIT